MDIEKEVLARIRPSPDDEEAIKATVHELVEKVKATDTAKEVDFEPYLVGSIAKGTHLTDPDIDLFLLFDPSVPREKLEVYGVSIGREAIGGREHYAEHPYIRGEFNGLKIDLVPAYKIIDAEQKMTAVDRTPFHTEYVKAHLAEEKQDHVRLLKRFMKGIGTYGAEARVEGLSGYLCEILIIKFGSFQGVLGAAKDWKKGEAIFIEEPSGTKFDSPLVFIDPVDRNRNVASAVSLDSLATFIVASGLYLDSPRAEFFFPNELPVLGPEEIKEKLAHRGGMLALTLPKPDIIDDILYPQVRKFQRNLGRLLESRDFMTVASRSGIFDSQIVLLFEMEHFELPLSALHRGPPIWISDNSKHFLDKWRQDPDALSEPFIRDGHWHVLIRRKHVRVDELASSNMSSLDIGKDLNKLKSDIRVYGPELPPEQVMNRALSTFLDKRMPWER